MFSFRALRRRWILAVIFLGVALYLITSLFNQRKILVTDEYQVKHSLLRQPFQWNPKVADVETNTSFIVRCRNSVQGKQWVVDERGYACERESLTVGGCCDTKTTKTTRYNCSTCKTNRCCMVYEHCVSCCLQPAKQALLQRVLKQARESVDKLYESVSDHFELCLAKCRTSSKSVQHENSYRDPKAKHCYGEDPPELQVVTS